MPRSPRIVAARPSPRSLALAVLACLALLVLPAGATAQSVAAQGSPLTANPSYPYNCETRWILGSSPPFDYTPYYVGPSTCGMFGPGTSTADSHLVPGPGRVTSARVKSGATPAPLTITILRQYTGIDQANPAGSVTTCCLVMHESAVFTPTANAITEVPLDFPVETKLFDPQTKQAGYHDIVGINVQGEGSLPIADRGNRSSNAGKDVPAVHMGFPAPKPGQNVNYGWYAGGFELLMNYSWCAGAATRQACGKPTGPVPPTGPTPPAGGGGAATPAPAVKPATIASRRLKLQGRSVPVAVTCAMAARCKGTVRLQTKARKPVVLGRKRLSIAAGKKATVRVPLSAKSRRRIGRKGLAVSVRVDLGGGKVVSRGVTLRK